MQQSTARAFMTRHVGQFYAWMLKRDETRFDVQQEIELAVFSCGDSEDKQVIRNAQKQMSARLYQLAKDAGYYKPKHKTWTPRFVGMLEAVK